MGREQGPQLGAAVLPAAADLLLLSFWEGGKDNGTFGASGEAGRWVGAGGSWDGDAGIGK